MSYTIFLNDVANITMHSFLTKIIEYSYDTVNERVKVLKEILLIQKISTKGYVHVHVVYNRNICHTIVI